MNGFGAAEQFSVGFCGAAEEKIGMSLGVVAKKVSPRGNFFGEGRRFAHPLANEKECSFGVVAVEQIEKFGRDGGIRSVVKSERQFASLPGVANSVPE